jgi:pimeloyl-ACP methyl ester carboxylesterase
MASVRSRDGTTIGYRRLGDGPGVVLMHGGGQASQNLMRLAGALSDSFAIYLPDRRGHGMSGPYSEDHGIGKEVEDLDALLGETGAHNMFGLSVGAVIAIEAARSLPGITKLALSPGSSTDRRPSRSFVLTSLRALHLDRGSGPTGIAANERRRAVDKNVAVDHDLVSR